MAIERTWTVASRGIGLPDYSAPGLISQTPEKLPSSGADLTELAARLGSPNVFDRRGNIVWMDNFDSGIDHWSVTDGIIGWSSEFFEYGGFSAKFSCLAPSYEAAMNKRIWVPTPGNWGIEVAFTIDANIDTVKMFLTHYRPAELGGSRRCELRYDADDDELQIRAETGVITIIDDCRLLGGEKSTFHKMKIVGDFINDRYLRYKLNVFSGTLTNPLQIMASTGNEYLRIDLYMDSDAVDAYGYMDSLIITQNEPSEV